MSEQCEYQPAAAELPTNQSMSPGSDRSAERTRPSNLRASVRTRPPPTPPEPPPSFGTCLAVCLVSAASQIASRAFWIELPALIEQLAASSSSAMTGASKASLMVSDMPVDQALIPSSAAGLVAADIAHEAAASLSSTSGWILFDRYRLFAAVAVCSNAAAFVVYLVSRRACCSSSSSSSSSGANQKRTDVEARVVWVSLAFGIVSLMLAAAGLEISSRLIDEEITSAGGNGKFADGVGIFSIPDIPLIAILAGTALSTVGGSIGALALLHVVGQFKASLSSQTPVPVWSLKNRGIGSASLICAVMCGDALASLVPRIVAVAQGVGTVADDDIDGTNETSTAPSVDHVGSGTITGSLRHRLLNQQLSHISVGGSSIRAVLPDQLGPHTGEAFNSRIIGVTDAEQLRFSEPIYFASCAVVILIGAVCFAVLRCCCFGASSSTSSAAIDGRNSNEQHLINSSSTYGGASVTNASSGSIRRFNTAAAAAAAAADDHKQLVPLVAPCETTTSSPRSRANDNMGARERVVASGVHRTDTDVVAGCTKISILDDGTERQSTSMSTVDNSHNTSAQKSNIDAATALSTSVSCPHRRPANKASVSKSVSSTFNRPKLFQLLIAIVLLTTAVISGPLSDVTAHGVYPTGSWAFAIGTIGCDLAAAAASVVAARATARSEMSTVIAMTCLGTILLTYFGALIAFGQHIVEGRAGAGGRTSLDPGAGVIDTALMMGSTGEYLAVAAWVTIVGVFSFARVRIGVECRLAGPEALFWYACALRIGDIVGSASAVGQISVGRFFKRHVRESLATA